MLETSFYRMWPGTQDNHDDFDFSAEFALVGWDASFVDLVLDGVVEVFVWIQFGAVGWQVKQFDAVLVFSQPFFDGLAVVHAQVVDDEEYLTLTMFDETPKEFDKSVGIERFFERHPVHFSLIADGTDEAAVKALGWLANHGVFALGRKAPAAMSQYLRKNADKP